MYALLLYATALIVAAAALACAVAGTRFYLQELREADDQ